MIFISHYTWNRYSAKKNVNTLFIYIECLSSTHLYSKRPTVSACTCTPSIYVYGFAAQKQIVDVCGHIRFDIFRTQTIRKHSYLILIINHCVAAVCRTNKLALETRTFRTLHEIKYSLRACCMTLGVSNRPYKLL